MKKLFVSFYSDESDLEKMSDHVLVCKSQARLNEKKQKKNTKNSIPGQKTRFLEKPNDDRFFVLLLPQMYK